jgi:hypothetical protein
MTTGMHSALTFESILTSREKRDLRSLDLTNVNLGDNDFRGTMLTNIGGSFQHAGASLS